MRHDFRFAIRLLAREKAFAAAATLALALGLGVNNTVFTVVNVVLFRGAPLADADRLVSIDSLDARGRPLGNSRPDFEDWRDGTRSFAGLSLIQNTPANLSDAGRPAEQYRGSYQSTNLFGLVGQSPVLGRDFRPEEELPGAGCAVIISDSVWKSRYGGDPRILGHALTINDSACTIVGVMPPDFKFPFNNDIWLPFAQLPPATRNAARGVRAFSAIGRLAPGTTVSRARAEFDAVSRRLALEFPDTNKDVRADLVPYNERASAGPIRLILLSLMGAVGFVLLIACANVANLMLARSAVRAREIAIRASLGATRWHIIRQLLAESIVLALVAGAIGFALSIVGVRLFDAAITADIGKPNWMTFTMDRVSFAFFAAVTLGTGIVFGLAPALHVSRAEVREVLRDAGGRSATAGARARRWTSALIVTEIALTLVLLAGAGFMTRSFLALYRISVGAETSHLLTMRFVLPLTTYPTSTPRVALYQRIEERMRGVEALRSIAITSHAPLSGGFARQLLISGHPLDPGERVPEVTMLATSAGYFGTLGVPILRGRALNDLDGTPGHESAVINQRLAAMYFSGEDPIGLHITLVDRSPGAQSVATKATIIGIVPTIRQRDYRDPDPDPVVYLPYRADAQRAAMLIVRTDREPASAAAIVRDEMRAIDPDLPLFNVMTMDDRLALQRWSFRVFGVMFAIFAGIALVLSAIGLYAVTAYSVTQRTAEIGVRMALGARADQVLWLVLRGGLVHISLGLAVGLAGALAVGTLLRSALAQTGARDPVTLAVIATVMGVVSINACLWPCRRATRLDPVAALRTQ